MSVMLCYMSREEDMSRTEAFRRNFARFAAVDRRIAGEVWK